MKKNLFGICLTIILCLACFACLAACNPKGGGDPSKVTVTYMANGKVFGTEQVEIGGTAKGLGRKPEKKNFDFVDWFRDDGTFQEAFDFTDTLTENITVYALFMPRAADASKLLYSSDGTTVTGYDGVVYNELTIPSQNNGVNVTKIASRAFSRAEFLTKVNFPSTLTDIRSYAFFGCVNLDQVALPAALQAIGSYAFSNCNALKELSVAQGNAVFRSEGNCVIAAADDTLVVGSVFAEIPNSVKIIGSGAFYGLETLTNIRIPAGVTHIEHGSFTYTSLEHVDFPDSVTDIEYDAFRGCTQLEEVTFGSGLKKIEILSTTGAFSGCYNLKTITMPNDNEIFRAEGNCLIEKGAYNYMGDKIVFGCMASVIPDGVRIIGNSSFYGCGNLQSVAIPASVTMIEYPAFSYCAGLANISVAAGNAAYRAENNCLIDIASGEMVLGCKTSVIPSDVTVIGSGAFQGSSIESVVIPDHVTQLNDSVFADCNLLTNVTIGTGVKSIPARSFRNCDSLESVSLHDEITTIGSSAFEGCGSLTSIVVPDSVTDIQSKAFQDCAALTGVTIGSGVQRIDNAAFKGCDNLTAVTMAAQVWEVMAYDGAPEKTAVTFSDASVLAQMLTGQYADMCWKRTAA